MLWRSSLNSALAQIADFVTFYFAYALAYMVWIWLHAAYPGTFPDAMDLYPELYVIVGVLSFVCVLLFQSYMAYSYQRFTSLVTEYFICFRVALLNFVIGVTLIFLLGYKNIPRTILLLGFLISFVLSLAQKTLLFIVARYIRKKGRNRKRVLLVGTGIRAKIFIETVHDNFGWGLDIVGLLTGDKEKVGKEFYGYRVLDQFSNIQNVLKTLNPEEVIVTISTSRFDQIKSILEVCEREGVQVRMNSDFLGEITKSVKIDNVYGLTMISFEILRRTQSQIFIKRIIDIVGSLAALLVFCPLMLAAAIGIWINDGRPVLFQWNVVGLNKKPFTSWKFRTMVRNADTLRRKLMSLNEMDGPVFKIKDDPRILPFGRLLRRWSIDETPQLFSVLRGDMSLVGPRPAFPHELERYDSWQKRRFSVKPGLTCLWQINGRNRITSFNEWAKLDLQYIDNWTIGLDLKILLRTVPVVLGRQGAS